jgi:hypothetical protein
MEEELIKMIIAWAIKEGNILWIIVTLGGLYLTKINRKDFIKAFSSTIDAVIESKKLKLAIKEKEKEIASLRKIITNAEKSKDLKSILDTVRDKLNLDYVFIMEYSNGTFNLAGDCKMFFTIEEMVTSPLKKSFKYEFQNKSLSLINDIIIQIIEKDSYDSSSDGIYLNSLYLESDVKEIAVFLKTIDGDEFGSVHFIFKQNFQETPEDRKKMLTSLELTKKLIETTYDKYRKTVGTA